MSGATGGTVLVAAHRANSGRIGRLDQPRGRTVVVAPHPDDETLSAGGLILRQRQRGLPVVVVAVTDGEAAYPGQDPSWLAHTRRSEQEAALAALGVVAGSILRLGLPDGEVAHHEGQLAVRLRELVEPGDVVVAPWCHDRHPDHEASGRAARQATAGRGCTSLGSLFWAHHSVAPGAGLVPGLVALTLTDDEVEARAAALRAHRSQLDPDHGSPVLRPDHIDHLGWPVEYFVAGGCP